MNNYQQYITDEINKLQIESEFKKFVVDILLRRTQQYDLTFEEIQDDIISIQNNLQKVEISDNMSMLGVDGEYNSSKKEIKLSVNSIFKNKPDAMYQVFAHELYHVFSQNKNGEDMLAGNIPINRYTGQYNKSLLEALIEKSSYKTVFPTTISNEKEKYYASNYNSIGYEELTFICDLLEACHGCSEQELLKNGHKSREKLANFLGSLNNENQENTLDFLDILEANYALLHGVECPLDKDNSSIQIQQKNVINALIGVNIYIYKRLLERIGNIQNNEEINENYIDNLKFDYNKIYSIMKDRIEYFGNKYNINELQSTIENMTMVETSQTFKSINQMEAVLKRKENLPSGKYEQLMNWAKWGNLDNYDNYEIKAAEKENREPNMLEDFDIFIEKKNEKYFKNLPEEIICIRNKIENNSSKEWNNSIAEEFYNIIYERAYKTLGIPEQFRKGYKSVLESSKVNETNYFAATNEIKREFTKNETKNKTSFEKE